MHLISWIHSCGRETVYYFRLLGIYSKLNLLQPQVRVESKSDFESTCTTTQHACLLLQPLESNSKLAKYMKSKVQSNYDIQYLCLCLSTRPMARSGQTSMLYPLQFTVTHGICVGVKRFEPTPVSGRLFTSPASH